MLALLLGLGIGGACGEVEESPTAEAPTRPASSVSRDGLVRGFTRVSLPPTGEPLPLDLRAGGALGVNALGAREDVRLAFERQAQAPFAFTLTISAPRGAVQRASGPDTNLAPIDGFDHEEEQVRGDDTTAHQLLHYFARLEDGSHARLTLWLRTQGRNHHARISIRTTHNPRGRALDTFDGWDDLPVEPPIGFLSPPSRARAMLR